MRFKPPHVECMHSARRTIPGLANTSERIVITATAKLTANSKPGHQKHAHRWLFDVSAMQLRSHGRDRCTSAETRINKDRVSLLRPVSPHPVVAAAAHFLARALAAALTMFSSEGSTWQPAPTPCHSQLRAWREL